MANYSRVATIMLLWLKFPFFLFRLSLLLILLIFRFFGFKIVQNPQVIANFILFIAVGGLGYYYTFYPPELQLSTLSPSQLGLDLETIQQESLTTQRLTQGQALQKLIEMEQNLEQQLKNHPTLLSQKTYIDLVLLSYYAGENKKANQYLNQARFANPNNSYFK